MSHEQKPEGAGCRTCGGESVGVYRVIYLQQWAASYAAEAAIARDQGWPGRAVEYQELAARYAADARWEANHVR